ncbi:MAG: hypothetical protein DRQ88_03235 [Epsilonproteobacteria bacterium]|nr:MAG: hypothetical protein DRQ89_01525 [Campylobacterota bacterium]RLA67333.1 MAG: hypothetical protein DRQ88_03235 [Campylobacterota bacterium]
MLILILLLLFSTASYSATPFKYVLKEMQRKNYAYALVKLKKIKGTPNLMDRRYFLEAVCLTNLDDSKKAINRLKKIKNKFNGVDFELGKAFYFTGDFKKAKNYFKKSINQGYKKAQSYHYLGNSYFKQENFRAAKTSFQTLLTKTTPSKWVLQDTYYQIGSIHLEISKRELRPEDMKNILKDHVLTYFKKSLQISPESKVAREVRKKIYLVKTKYEIN